MNSDPRGLRTDGSRGDTKGCGIAQRYYQTSIVAGCDAPGDCHVNDSGESPSGNSSEFYNGGDRRVIVHKSKESKDVFTTKQIEDMALLGSKQNNFNAMDSFNKACYLLQRECLEGIAM
ncbi:hypothetical protein F2Q69_00053686 [Brassica cretica]|uniref:Uncharacterized protein n=1 Tax=Brassica cretica TaxID=69181 RepID=A0A8S9MZL6_BRACR|nr:hypothetical protein F2Q69_00053686 [Brassica cretica]